MFGFFVFVGNIFSGTCWET